MLHKVAFCRADIAKRDQRRRNSKALVKLTENEGVPQSLICEFDEVVQSRWRKVRSAPGPRLITCADFPNDELRRPRLGRAAAGRVGGRPTPHSPG